MKRDTQLSDLRLVNLSLPVSNFVIRGRLSVAPGERVALRGRSGSGKTTLLRVIAGLHPLRVGQGQVFLGKEEITSYPAHQREVGFVFQDYALFSGMTVLENICFGLRMRKVSKEERRVAGKIWLKKIGLEEKAEVYPDVLSGGEKQRVAWARAVIWKPRMILLDEPFSALDPALRKEFRTQLIDLHHEWPVPLLWVSHDDADVEEVATSQITLQVDPTTSIHFLV
jgi:sulfate transport system ATP-binding protein